MLRSISIKPKFVYILIRASDRSPKKPSFEGFSSFAISTTIWSRNEPFTKLLTSWLVPSFLQHNLCLVVLEHCLLISVTKFHDRLQHVNSPNSREKQSCESIIE